ncbi:MAG: PP2C family serine/threonine-protein phosphatase, partial [Chlamydiales bacterium]
MQLIPLTELLQPALSNDTSVTPLSQEKIAKRSLWRPRSLPLNEAISKARRNMEKALVEHVSKERRKCYASAEEAIPSLETLLRCESRRELSVKKCYVHEAQGSRPTMEDAHFHVETSAGVFVGVLDGHAGEAVALFARDQFQKRWFELLEKTGANVHQAFEFLFDETHELVANRPEWNGIGTTAVLCHINKQTHQIYTATVGDSEANIYRNIDGQLKSIPLSCVRDWHSRKDAARAAAALENPQIAVEWPAVSNPKRLRFPRWNHGVNVSRAIGDQDCRNTKEKPGV